LIDPEIELEINKMRQMEKEHRKLEKRWKKKTLIELLNDTRLTTYFYYILCSVILLQKYWRVRDYPLGTAQ